MNALHLSRGLLGVNTIDRRAKKRRADAISGACCKPATSRSTSTASRLNARAVVARLGNGGTTPRVCFTGQMDTLPLGGMPWTRDAFAGEGSSGRLYGRGSTDMM